VHAGQKRGPSGLDTLRRERAVIQDPDGTGRMDEHYPVDNDSTHEDSAEPSGFVHQLVRKVLECPTKALSALHHPRSITLIESLPRAGKSSTCGVALKTSFPGDSTRGVAAVGPAAGAPAHT
jgi:hypothetical protein